MTQPDELWTFAGYFLDADDEPCAGAEMTVHATWQNRAGETGVRSGTALTNADGGYEVSIPLPANATPTDTSVFVTGERPGYIEGSEEPDADSGWVLSASDGAVWADPSADTVSFSWDSDGTRLPFASAYRDLTLNEGDVTATVAGASTLGDATITVTVNGAEAASLVLSGEDDGEDTGVVEMTAGAGRISVSFATEFAESDGSATITLGGGGLPVES